MEGYFSEEQQVEAIKKWWKENGTAVLSGVVIGLAVLFGGRAWFSYKKAQAEDASLNYSALLATLQQGKSSEALAIATQLTGDSHAGEYANMAGLVLARLQQDKGDVAAAQATLKQVLKQTGNAQLRILAQLRLARLLADGGKPQKALDTLDGIKDAAFAAPLDNLRGDIYLAMGKKDQARAAYDKAEAAGDHSQLLIMKRQELDEGGAK